MNFGKRLFEYFLGFLIMTLGIALSVKSDLGVSPVSSIPYTLTCVIGLEMGKATIIFHIFLVLLQILILRKQFQTKNLLQVLVGVVFGYFTTFCNYLMTFVNLPDNMPVRLTLMILSTFLIAFGIYLYVPTNLIPLAGEGAMLAISEKYNKKFSSVKLVFDASMVVISLITCLVLLHNTGSVGIGTIIAAFCVGIELKWITKIAGKHQKSFPEQSTC